MRSLLQMQGTPLLPPVLAKHKRDPPYPSIEYKAPPPPPLPPILFSFLRLCRCNEEGTQNKMHIRTLQADEGAVADLSGGRHQCIRGTCPTPFQSSKYVVIICSFHVPIPSLSVPHPHLPPLRRLKCVKWINSTPKKLLDLVSAPDHDSHSSGCITSLFSRTGPSSAVFLHMFL